MKIDSSHVSKKTVVTYFRQLAFAFLLVHAGHSVGFTLGSPLPRSIKLSCLPLPYKFSCSIPNTTSPEFSANCWFQENGRSFLMDTDQNFLFFNDIVTLKLNNAGHGIVRERRTGRSASCVRAHSSFFEPQLFFRDDDAD